jgi:hypothetical protein
MAKINSYFVVGFGVGAFFAGLGGADLAGCDLMFPNTELPPVRRDAKIDSVIDVTMKITAAQVVALLSRVAAPRGPNAVWLPMPPKAAAMSALLPLCSSTTMIRNKQTMTCITVIVTTIMSS